MRKKITESKSSKQRPAKIFIKKPPLNLIFRKKMTESKSSKQRPAKIFIQKPLFIHSVPKRQLKFIKENKTSQGTEG